MCVEVGHAFGICAAVKLQEKGLLLELGHMEEELDGLSSTWVWSCLTCKGAPVLLQRCWGRTCCCSWAA